MASALISNIQHFNVHDGPGFRTVIFFQGCTLRCKWCQNPETIPMRPSILYNPSLCIGCLACIDSCSTKAIKMTPEGIKTDYNVCSLCGKCTEECYSLARTMSSHLKTVDEVFAEVIKEKRAYIISGGGITLSGGEPLLHVDFAIELLQRIKSEGVNTAVETAGNVPTAAFTKLYKTVDTFLYDFKMYTKGKHKYWTDSDNALILHNLKYISDIHHNIVIRIPLIPTVNDSDDEFHLMMKFLCTLKNISRIHILPFHNLGANKYSMLGKEYEVKGISEDNDERIRTCVLIAESYGFRVNIGGSGFLSDKLLIQG